MSATIADYMVTELVCFAPDDDIVEAMRRLLAQSISGAPVVDPQGKLCGILSERDCFEIIYRTAYHQDWGGQVQQYMSREVEHLSADCSVVEAVEKFLSSSFRRFPVLRNGDLVGMICRRDILAALDKIYLNSGSP